MLNNVSINIHYIYSHSFFSLFNDNLIVYIPQSKNSEFCAPLTSFDWNETDPNILGASSIDTTCTLWGLEVSTLLYVLVKCNGIDKLYKFLINRIFTNYK